MGGVCIKILQAHIPEGVSVSSLTVDLKDRFRALPCGGFAYRAKRYRGPVWKYDMGSGLPQQCDARLPAGGALYIKAAPPANVQTYIARITAENRANRSRSTVGNWMTKGGCDDIRFRSH